MLIALGKSVNINSLEVTAAHAVMCDSFTPVNCYQQLLHPNPTSVYIVLQTSLPSSHIYTNLHELYRPRIVYKKEMLHFNNLNTFTACPRVIIQCHRLYRRLCCCCLWDMSKQSVLILILISLLLFLTFSFLFHLFIDPYFNRTYFIMPAHLILLPFTSFCISFPTEYRNLYTYRFLLLSPFP